MSDEVPRIYNFKLFLHIFNSPTIQLTNSLLLSDWGIQKTPKAKYIFNN